MKLESIHKVYFIGIGGIGMSNLARYMMHIGKEVLGYDKTASPITEALQKEGAKLHFEIDLKWVLHQNFDRETTLIVYTPAVKQTEHEELNYFLTNDFQVIKRSQLLGIITENTVCLAVAGTHGKTTTSTMLGHILKVANVSATSFLGGISENYHTNLILGGTKYSVVEADEYDRSFLRLHPDYACITATDSDHLDIYQDAAEFEKTFHEFANLVTKKVVVRNGININGQTYGIDDHSDYQAKNVRVQNGAFVFDVQTPTDFHADFHLFMPGRHNVLNALAALSLANSIGVSLPQIAEAIATFKGVERRFTYRVKTENLILIDDYAHHPTELRALYQAVRELYPQEQLHIIFQPHTYTRTRDFMDGFVQSLSEFDKISLLPIYAAREHPIEGISSDVLTAKIIEKNPNTSLLKPENILEEVLNSKAKIVLMVGAGDIGEMIMDISQKLKSINHA